MASELAENAKAIASRRERVAQKEKQSEKRAEERLRRREADVIEESQVKPGLEAKKKIARARSAAAWAEAKIESAGYQNTVPRDFYERGVFDWDAPEETKKHVHVFFDSELRERRNPLLRTFDANLYEPLTKERAEELGISVPYGRWTEQGHLKVGHDAIVKIAPKRIIDERKKAIANRSKIADRMRKHEEFYRQQAMAVNKMGRDGDATMPIGDIQIGQYETPEQVINASEGREVENMKLSGFEGYVPPDHGTIEEDESDG